MLSLRDFKSFEINNQIKVTGGGYTSHSSGNDFIYTNENGETAMDVNGIFAGCSCNSGNTSFTSSCCSQQ